MVDMDLDEVFDGPTKGPIRPARFAPKGAKFKPKFKAEPSESATSDHLELSSESKKEDFEIKPEVKPELTNDAVDMDVEVKPDVKEEETDNLMETKATKVELEPEVVREIDIYFTPTDTQTQFYLFQYPLRPRWRPYELDDRCEVVRMKPASAEVEIDLATDADSINYDAGADPRVQLKKQTLTSTWKPHLTSGSTVGILIGNKLQLSPVHAVVQLRPSMHHLDSKESKRKTVPHSNEQESNLAGTSMYPGWVSLKYHGARSDMAVGYLQKMTAQEVSEIYFSMSSYEYLKSLCPGTSSDRFCSKGPSRRILLALPLKERFRTLLCKGPQVLRFEALKHLAPDEPLEEVLEALHEHARLVQGLWFAKSPLVYGTDQGIDVLARDYVLLLFSKNVIVHNSKIPQRPQLAIAMKNVLKVLARERAALNDWKLREIPDLSFIKLNPTVVKKQEEEWECLEQKLNGLMSGGRKGPGIRTTSMSSITNNPTPLISSTSIATRTPSGSAPRTGMSEEVREATTKTLLKFFGSIKACRIEQISQRLREMTDSESARPMGFAEEAVAAINNIDAFPDELSSIISQVAINIHGICIPISSPDHKFDEFRKVVIDLFIAEGPNAKLKKAAILEAAKMKLKREITQNEYKEVLQELCLSQSSAWVLRKN